MSNIVQSQPSQTILIQVLIPSQTRSSHCPYCNTCGDNAESKATSLVKILTGDCQRGCIDQTTTQAYSWREDKKRTEEEFPLARVKDAKTFNF